MSKLTDQASYLKGLAEGLSLNTEKASNRLLLELINLTNDLAQEVESLSNSHSELNDFVESIDADLANVEEILFDDGTVESGDDEEEDDTEEADPSESDVQITYSCPHCGKELTFDVSEIDFETYRCPECGELVFPEVTEDGEENDILPGTDEE